MKSCPQCQRTFPDDAGFCPADGTALAQASLAPVAPSAEDARIGTRMSNRYEIRRVVADGGMGRVYEAIDKQNNSRVAVKVLHDDVAKDEVALERFKREYEISSLLPHQHIVSVTDFQRDMVANMWMLVMEFLDGEELRYVLKREKVIPPERVVRMLSQVAIGLDEAHQRNLIHRDLKPDNVFLCGTREGDIVKILDFGSAKDKASNKKKLTQLGTTIGSPFYMSPEQAQGLDTLDQRADVWALAAIAYECMCGTVPFKGVNGPSILLEILTKEPIPPTVTGKDQKYPIPPAMDRVILTALKKTASLRTPSIGAFADQVGQAYGLEGSHATWATTSEEELDRAIASKLDVVMAAPVPEKNKGDATDSFFGEDDSLGAGMDAAFHGGAPSRSAGGVGPTAPMSARADHDVSAVPAGLPAAKIGWWIVPVIVVVAMALGVLIAKMM
jgi:serine/threonine-protein kinase